MSDQLTNDIMTTIRAIKEYKETHGNTLEINQDYKTFGTYNGIADHLQNFNTALTNDCTDFLAPPRAGLILCFMRRNI